MQERSFGPKPAFAKNDIVFKNMTPKIIAHRGDREHFPENTIASFKSAVDKGVDAIELDIHLSKDKKLIVHHDYFLGTTNNGEGLISEEDSQYIKSLDAGSWFSDQFANEKVPFLEEVFELFGDKIVYEIELKGYTAEFLEIALGTAKKYGLVSSIEFTSPHAQVLSRVKEMEPNATIGVFIQEYPSWMSASLGEDIIKGTAILGRLDVVHCPLLILSKEFVGQLHDLGLKVHAANCDTEESIQRAIELKVDQFSTNKVDLALSLK
ncbi:MAG: hypothetical protein A3E36_00645 [Candidatus Andersenbacteria bacterium RIFCSPHIGHO2_12_FULL_45_11b]|uniref:GP-PDE domain-containing protein n=1 Tax=Candidatus Andersenbacteria bacterium RIFCSPHIGHO2_12_FULL_45_11b TaxID=1797282 RepID=A0A1G1X5A2_9BACT|nr:MAG: hypothetical protein A3E36_00645 [Candidatus Andersenbacteria bacterium RIFCSPHIGHO2_12_FULL_45_11b]